MNILAIALTLILDVIPAGEAFLKPILDRDSILVADQVRYGIEVDNLLPGVTLNFPDLSQISSDTLTLVKDWQVDTLDAGRFNAYVVLAPFEAATYALPDIPVLKELDGQFDTLVYKGCEMEVKTIPIDTATFVVHDLKDQINYPVTFAEVAAVTGMVSGILAVVAGLVLLIVFIVRRAQGKVKDVHKDPAYIVALRDLENWRGKEHWESGNQKRFYSGVTDILKLYIEDRFGVDAPEMTTAELFDALKASEQISPELYSSLKDMFERADFVKFAKYTASEQENASVVPLGVRFVTSTIPAAEGGAE